MSQDLETAYARRAADPLLAGRYSPLRADVWQTLQERQRALIQLFNRLGWQDLAERRLLEVGCGSGGNLLELLQLGFSPAQLQGAELLPERWQAARERLPAALTLHAGDASRLPLQEAGFDAVYAATVFSSLLDDATQQGLAAAMWRCAKAGGGVLIYDFCFDNPRNADVRAVPLARLQQLFPQGRLRSQRLTLAPPLARPLCRLHPALYRLANALPWLRTHRLTWIEKNAPP